MSGYRSLKRVLGESNLERKCRWLFGICVGGLILLAFWWVDRISEGLIEETAQSQGRGLVRNTLIDLHWQWWTRQYESESRQKLIQKQNEDLARDKYVAHVLSPDTSRNAEVELANVFLPETPGEQELLAELKREVDQIPSPLSTAGSAANQQIGPRSGPADRERLQAAILEGKAQNTVPVFRAVRHADRGLYDYYQVVHWTHSCTWCHDPADSQKAQAGGAGAADMPFRVIRISMSDSDTRANVNKTRAILLAVGILTVFLAMVALYYVVKYIVIKPLSHLRDVSDAVARGDMQQRADIHTNDEFEDLAASFNKMLVHLIQAQGELQDANEELDQKVDELAHLNMQLHEMNRLKGEFLATMSHELRTPLNSIIGFSEVLHSLDTLNEKQKRYAQTIHKSGRDLLEMINDILDIAKLEAGKMEVRLSEFRIDSVIANQCDVVRQMAEEKNIDLRTEIDPNLPLLYQDQTKVQQILTNLLSNAIKFTPEGGRITVGARGDSRGQIELWVADTGVGISPNEREIIFEKFRQGKAVLGRDNLTREYSGTGLGLSIVKELCKLLGGEVTVESELGKGSTFRVFLPWMRTDTAAAAAKLAARLDDVSRPRRLEPEIAAAGSG